MFIRFLIFFVLIVLVELYFLQALKTISIDYTPQKRKIIFWIAYSLAGINILISSVAMFYPPPEWNSLLRFISSVALILFVCKLIGSSFLLIDDVIRLFRWMASLFNKAPKHSIEEGANQIVSETEKEEASLLKKSKASESIIEERLLNAYKRIRTNVMNGLGVVTVERDACGGCFNKIPPQRQLDIRTHKKVIVCEHCGRILVDAEILSGKPVKE